MVVLSPRPDGQELLAAVLAGAAGYLSKEISPDRLPQALDGVIRGEVALPRRYTQHLLDELRGREIERTAVAAHAKAALTKVRLQLRVLVAQRHRAGRLRAVQPALPRCLHDRLAGHMGATHRPGSQMLEGLPASPVYDRAQDRPTNRRGVYLFSTKGASAPLRRTHGITARTRRAGRQAGHELPHALDQHTRAGSSPTSAPFAMWLARAQATERDIVVPPVGLWKARDEHSRIKVFVTERRSWIADELQDARRRPRR